MRNERCDYPKPVSYGEIKAIPQDPNRIPSYIKPETVEIGYRRIVGGKTGIDINI